jgi:hypothetical protein
MDIENFTSNSHKSKETAQKTTQAEKKINKVVTGPVKVKKNEIRKFTDVFISEDASNVKSYILMDVLVPAIKKAISDIVTNGIDMILYGETGRNRKSSTNASKVSYRSYYERDNDRRRDTGSSNVRSGFDYDDLVFDYRGDAEAVLVEMENIIEQYDQVSIGDMYDIAKISTPNFNVNKYGWTNLSNAKVVRVVDGYKIKLPKAVPLN